MTDLELPVPDTQSMARDFCEDCVVMDSVALPADPAERLALELRLESLLDDYCEEVRDEAQSAADEAIDEQTDKRTHEAEERAREAEQRVEALAQARAAALVAHRLDELLSGLPPRSKATKLVRQAAEESHGLALAMDGSAGQ